MDIVSRLKVFLKQNGIANSQFADTCEIPRPTLSQLLNGRNKKVSDEIITKIHNAYPALNILWLMFGDGDMIVPNANTPYPAQNEFQNRPAENTLFGNNSDGFSNTPATTAKQSISFGASDADFMGNNSAQQAQPTQGNAMQAVLQNMMQAGTRPTPTSSGGKHVTSIMVFYSDNSFETFLPPQPQQ